ncbi:FGGY-family carbohydrate kinase [Olivibacter sp. SDN3]|uniref:FGGY-family carbohydrate kinase n=1 Tax=Olivibacter sp. SDN3 TaxID=2764720 RepID=UPI0016516CC8|nr:FGGY-family carbohydrate kinase [Olivibacter sp. SDN3]QNL50442.1 FGGY-family carbohydrate kinase [Olivibacter sp. SDN3]
MNAYVIGIDIGTQGVRTAVVDATGDIIASTSKSFELTERSREEQSPLMWWEHTITALKELLHQASSSIDLQAIKAIAATSTSGTVIPIDIEGNPLHDALMYSDKRSAEEGEYCRVIAQKYCEEGFNAFNTSCGLPKIRWFTKHFPEKVGTINQWIHAADFITGRLSGIYDVTDYTNALKTGFDITNLQWPGYLKKHLVSQSTWLQRVVASGTVIGALQPKLAHKLNLASVAIVVGITDGCASQMASGAISPGDWNTTIGTTMVIKGVTKEALRDPEGRIYNHRHPEGFWMPGGASNTGADWISTDYEQVDLASLNEQAAKLTPTSYLSWPLKQVGERFPFISPQARGFSVKNLSKIEQYTSNMEGVAYLERYAYELIEKLSSEKVIAVFTAGGGSNSDTWLRIRSNVLNKPVYRCKEASGVLGAAICAASKTIFNTVTEAVEHMTHRSLEVYPERSLAARYDENYHKFIHLLIQKKYLTAC